MSLFVASWFSNTAICFHLTLLVRVSFMYTHESLTIARYYASMMPASLSRFRVESSTHNKDLIPELCTLAYIQALAVTADFSTTQKLCESDTNWKKIDINMTLLINSIILLKYAFKKCWIKCYSPVCIVYPWFFFFSLLFVKVLVKIYLATLEACTTCNQFAESD